MNQADKKQELIEAAGQIFLRYGYRKTTLDDLADAVGMRKSSLYHYFSSKDELFIEVSRTLLDEEYECFQKALNKPGTLKESLLSLSKSVNLHLHKMSEAAGELVGEINDYFPLVRDAVIDSVERLVQLITARIEKAVADGEYHPMPSRDLALIFLVVFRNAALFHHELPHFSEIVENKESFLDTLFGPYHRSERGAVTDIHEQQHGLER
jgi:AcrR family transcriptional regulator